MPHSIQLISVLVAVNLVLDWWLEGVFAAMVPDRAATSLFWLLMHALIELGLLFLLLRGAGKSPRFVQTAIALAIPSLIFSALAALLMFLLWPLPAKPEQLTAAQALGAVFCLPLLLWFAAIRTWIVQGATEYRWPTALLFALALPIAGGTIAVSLMRVFA